MGNVERAQEIATFMLENGPRTAEYRKMEVLEADRVQSTFRHRVLSMQFFVMILEWNKLRQFEAKRQENARTATRHIPKCGGNAQNHGLGGISRTQSAETRIESFGSFNLVLEWILVL